MKFLLGRWLNISPKNVILNHYSMKGSMLKLRDIAIDVMIF